MKAEYEIPQMKDIPVLDQNVNEIRKRASATQQLLPYAQSVIDAYQQEKTPGMPDIDTDLFYSLLRDKEQLHEMFLDTVEAPEINGVKLNKESLAIDKPTFAETKSAIDAYKASRYGNKLMKIIVQDSEAIINPSDMEKLIRQYTLYLDTEHKVVLYSKLITITEAVREIKIITGAKNQPINDIDWRTLLHAGDTVSVFKHLLSREAMAELV